MDVGTSVAGRSVEIGQVKSMVLAVGCVCVCGVYKVQVLSCF